MKNFLFTTLTLILFKCLIILKFTTEAVHIIPSESEFTLPAGASFTLQCFGNTPLYWDFPTDEKDRPEKIIKNTLIKQDYYKSTLTIKSAHYLDTGFYVCSSSESNANAEEEEAKIYIFVTDVKHLIVYNDSHSVLMQLQHEPFLIPCKPSFANVNITLWNEHEEILDMFPYDPYFGFTVSDPQLTDSGIYYCRAVFEDNKQELLITVHITPKTDAIKKPRIVFLGEKLGTPVVVGQDVVLECSVAVSLGVQIYFTWNTPHGEDEYISNLEIKNSAKDIKINGLRVRLSKSVLTLRQVTKEYAGIYMCSVMDNSNNTNHDEYNLQVHAEDTSFLNLTMEGKPIVIVRGEGGNTEWSVKLIAHPAPEITWLDPSGKKLPSDSKKYLIVHEINRSKVIIKDAKMRDSGHYTVVAENTSGKKTLKIYLAVEDKPQVTVNLLDEVYIKNEDYFVKCSVLAEPTATVSMSFIPCVQRKCDESRRKVIINHGQNLTLVTKEYVGAIHAEENGTITCSASNRYGNTSNFSSFIVTDAKPPVFSQEAMKNNSKYTVVPIGEIVNWTCRATGLPKPIIIWQKNGVLLKSNHSGIHIEHNNETLIIPIRSKDDDGTYICIAFNKAGRINTTFELKLDSTNLAWSWALGVIIFIVIIIVITIIALLIRKVRHEKKLREQITAAGLYYFQDGQIESLNPDLSIGEQADFLPYDKKWEIPREKIKLGIQLGSGAFGVVMKAEVSGLIDGESATTVAVKMAKKNSDVTLVKALVSELKIMSHLGQHLNVVNLLGACTSRIYVGEVLVVVEYCKYGNLHNFLLKHRDVFINEIDPQSGNLDFSERNNGNRSSTYARSNSEFGGVGSEYGCEQSANTELTTWYGPASFGEVNHSQSDQSPQVGEDGYLISTPFNEDKSYKRITTKDLICWGYQIARGMEYLASRKVLHGDLATRNILLAEKNVVKICDFGFAKSMYQDENYTKKGNDPLPLKWLSIEALRDRVFSTQSDIWAYGILLWEMFSMAKNPYPGRQFDQQLFDSLLEGYRMEKPEYATTDIYTLMLDCWNEQPMLRPSFTECADRLGGMLEKKVVQHYMELNDPYVQFNVARQAEHEDYLSMINAPTYSNFCGLPVECDPNYVNMSKSQQEEMELKPMIQPGNTDE